MSSLIFSALLPQSLFLNELNYIKTSNSSEEFPSNFQVRQSVTYIVEVNFSFTQISGFGDYFFKLPRLNDRQPSSTLTPMCPPFQESELLYHNLYGNIPAQTLINHTDRFQNTYDSYNASLNFANPEVKLSSKYRVKLNEISFDNILPSDIGIYNTSHEIFELYCNQSNTFYNRTDPDLINLSNTIVNPTDGPITKAGKIINWISENIEYNGSLDKEIGASEAYSILMGDCSEYSSLMITLLRIQNIPARKVTGFCVSNVHNFKPEIGDEFIFHSRSDGTLNLLGHAWIEYYVPNIGWIACDPTWHQVTGTYFNQIDYLRFNYNVGEHFFFPPDQLHSEFPLPYATGFPSGAYSYEFELKVTVVDTNYLGLDLLMLIIIAIVIVSAVIFLITLLVLMKRKRKVDY